MKTIKEIDYEFGKCTQKDLKERQRSGSYVDIVLTYEMLAIIRMM